MTSRITLVLAASAVALVGCGTTVPVGSLQGQSADQTAGNAGLGPSPIGVGSMAGSTSSAASAAGGQVAPQIVGGASGTGTTVVAGSATSGQTSKASAGLHRSGPVGSAFGVTARAIKIGVFTSQGFSGYANSLGVNAAVGDTHAEAQAVVTYLNAHGGIAGRRIDPVYYDQNIARAEANYPAEEQAACAAMTQDNHVYAVASAVGWGDENIYQCLAKAGVIASEAGETFDQHFFAADANYFYMPTEMNMTRVMSNNINALYRGGFFQGWDTRAGKPGTAAVKVGLIRNDTPSDTRVRDEGVKPALASHGLALAEDVAVSATNPGESQSQIQNAVLRFAADGITHVLFTFVTPLVFMEQAHSQKYYPRYGLQSRSSPGALLEGNAPKDEMHGSMGIGWQQYNDVDAAHDPGPPSARAKLCLQLLQQAGQNPSVRATALVGLWYCDVLFFLHDALAVAPNFTPAGFRAGAESLSRNEAASTFRSSFRPGQLHDGAHGYRLFAFGDSCGCYRYVTPVLPAT